MPLLCRFTDCIVKQVCHDGNDIFMDGVGWEGGDEWVRAQFRLYLLCLLRTNLNLQDDQDTSSNEELHRFNPIFIQMWRKTLNYKLWKEHVANEGTVLGDEFIQLPALHPFSGHLSIGDMRLHLSNSITGTEGGKKVTAAVANTGRAVAGGLSTAKGVFSSWMSSLKPSQEVLKEEGTEAKEAVSAQAQVVTEAIEVPKPSDHDKTM
jgi:hypothetical protein